MLAADAAAPLLPAFGGFSGDTSFALLGAAALAFGSAAAVRGEDTGGLALRAVAKERRCMRAVSPMISVRA